MGSTGRKTTTSLSKRQVALKYGFRSGLEKQVALDLRKALKKPVSYEGYKLSFYQPAKKRTYTPDFVLPNGIVIETKGRFLTEDRQKHLMIKESVPELDLRFVFNNPNARISKTSKTTYAAWCEKHGFKYAKGTVPLEWLKESPKGLPGALCPKK